MLCVVLIFKITIILRMVLVIVVRGQQQQHAPLKIPRQPAGGLPQSKQA
jgi:hypothetical protein